MQKFRQTGASTIVILIVLMFGAVVLTLALKLIPIYIDNSTIESVIHGLEKDLKITSYGDEEIRNKISKLLSINNIRSFKASDIKISREEGELFISLDYEVRENIFKNIDVIVSFENHFKTPIAAE